MNIISVLMAFVAYFLHSNDRSLLRSLSKDTLSAVNQNFFTERFPNSHVLFDQMSRGQELDWATLTADLIAYTKEYSARADARQSFIKTLQIFTRWMKTGANGPLVLIKKMSAAVEDPVLRGLFTDDAGSQSDAKAKLAKLVKKYGGDMESLTIDTFVKESAPDDYAAYQMLRRDMNKAWQAELSNFVRASGKKTVKMRELEKHFASIGVTHTMPTGFTGLIDAVGTWYTSDGEKISTAPKNGAMYPSVRMNPGYGEDSAYVFQVERADGKTGVMVYTDTHNHKEAKLKFEKVGVFDVHATRKKWLPLVLKFDESNDDTVAALILEILYQTSHRIGSPGGPGLTQIKVANVYPQTDGSMRLIYSGKHAVKTTAMLRNGPDRVSRAVADAMAALIEGKAPKEMVFTYWLRNGQRKPLMPRKVNDMFKIMCGNHGLTVHKLRTAQGSLLFRQFLDKVYEKRKSLTMEQATELLKQGGAIVGKELNHIRKTADGKDKTTHATALKSYIDPMLQAELFQHYQLPIPVSVEVLVIQDDVKGSAQRTRRALPVVASFAPLDVFHVTSAGEAPSSESKEVKPEDLDHDSEEQTENSDQSDDAAQKNIQSDELLLQVYKEGSGKHVLTDN